MADKDIKQAKNRSMAMTLLLIGLVILLGVLPFFVARNARFGGSDDQARQAVTQINKDFKPWFSPIWQPPSNEVASLIFALQAAVGAGVIGYVLGYWRGRKQQTEAGKP